MTEIQTVFCSACGKNMSNQATACPQCGHPNRGVVIANDLGVYAQGGKSRLTAGLFGILLGGIGIHKFYLNKAGLGVLYILFCWTFVPALIGLIEGIIYLTQDDQTFGRTQGVKVQPSS